MTRYRWLFLGLLFLGTSLNYMDRIIFAVLMPVIRKDIPVSEQEYGYLTAAFQAAYGIGNLALGKLVDVIGSRFGYLLSVTWWSVAAACHALSQRAIDLGIWRAALGLGEAGNFPAAVKTVAEWFPKKDRALAMGVCVASTNVAAMIGPPLFIALSAAYGWRSTFIAAGAAGLAVALAWGLLYRSPRQHHGVNRAELDYIESGESEEAAPAISWRAALSHRETWGFAFAKFFTDPVWWFYIYWLPLYLFDVRHLALNEIGWALPVIYLMADFGSVAGGWLPGYLIRRGWAPVRARKTAMAACVVWMPLAALAVFAPNIPLTVFLISLGTMGHQGWSANLFTTVSDVYPATAVGSVIGIGQALASVGGIIFSSLLPGYLISHFGYAPVFVILGSFHLFGFACVHLLMGGLKPVKAPTAEHRD
ncbi:MAG: MFS transporter [Bryobacteraceae bacterium]